MTILETFYILFKTNANTEAKADIGALDKQISSLAAKGKKLTDDDIKSLKELSKQREDAKKQLQEQQKEVDKTGDSFTNLAESAIKAITAYASFAALKSGLLNAADFNSNLEIQHQLYGQNVKDIAAYGAAVEQAGGSVEGFQGTLRNLTKAAADQGTQLLPLPELFKKFHDLLAPLPLHEALRLGGQFGLDDGTILAVRADDYQKLIDKGYELTQKTSEQTETARKFRQEWDATGQTFQRVASIIGTTVLPVLNSLLGQIEQALTETDTLNKFGKYHGFSDYINKRGIGGFLWDSLVQGGKQGISAAGIVGGGVVSGFSNIFGGTEGKKAERPIVRSNTVGQKVLDVLSPGEIAPGGENPGNAEYYAKIAQRVMGDSEGFALSAVGGYSNTQNVGGNKSTSLKTGDIHVHTQATDADGIAQHIDEALQDHFRITMSNYDDGVAQ